MSKFKDGIFHFRNLGLKLKVSFYNTCGHSEIFPNRARPVMEYNRIRTSISEIDFLLLKNYSKDVVLFCGICVNYPK